MKTAISIPDEVFKRAEKMAKATRVSRSELYTRALTLLLQNEPSEELKRAYDEAFSNGKDDLDTLRKKAARTTLLSIEWDEK